MNANILRRILGIFILLFIGIIVSTSLIGITSAQTLASISPSTQQIDEGQNFVISVYVEPDAHVSGAQFNLQFDSSLVNVVRITEGDLLNQNGDSTLFNAGTIDNSQGTVTDIYALIFGKSNVTTSGIFANIDLVALNKSGISAFELSNVIISDSEGQSLPITVSNGTTNIGDVSYTDIIQPTIAITSPTDGTTVSASTITATGTVTDDTGVTSLTVDGNSVSLGAGGSFITTVSLTSGVNIIPVIATDAAGNTATQSIIITYTPSSVTTDTIQPTIAIASPTDGTTVSASTITVTGTATDDTGVISLTVNGNSVSFGAGGFFMTTVSLTSGVNTVSVIATDAADNTATQSIIITYTPSSVTTDTIQPTITITPPTDGTTITIPTITVSGTVIDDTGVTGLTVNGNSVNVESDGSFTTTVSLSSGLNTITVVATNAFGNSTTETVTVTYSTAVSPLVFAITPSSRIAQIGTPITIFMSVINAGTTNATDVSISQASGLAATIGYQTWDGITLTGTPDTPVDIGAGETANFVLTIDATSEFASSPMTFDVSSLNGATAPVNGVNTLTMAASTTSYADVIIMSTSLDVSTAVNTATAFALATTNVGTASATDVSLVVDIPSTITGLSYQVNETNLDGSIKGPATGLTIPVGGSPTFAVFLTPTQAIDYDPANNRIVLKLVDGNGKVVGAQSVAVSTT